MIFSEAMEFIHAESWRGSQLGLERMRELMNRLGNPQNELRFVHIAGTNGKGSVCAMLSEILFRAGYRTGRFISPFVERFRERIRVDKADISEDELTALVQFVKPHVEAMKEKPTEFELITGIAFLYFKNKGCDIVVLEVGLGGRLDATNIIPPPEVAVITNIGIDHEDILGHTLEEIVVEKAGIIKRNTKVVVCKQDEVIRNVIQNRCVEMDADISITDVDQRVIVSSSLDCQVMHYRHRKELKLRLLGRYQFDNLMLVLDTVDLLIRKGYTVPDSAIYRGIEVVKWPGRFEVIHKQPICIVDGAHNPKGVEAFIQGIEEYFPDKKITFVMGVMKDKDYKEMVRQLTPLAHKFVVVGGRQERFLPSAELKKEVEKRFGGEIRNAGMIENAMAYILDTSTQEEIVCILGTLHQVGQVKLFMMKNCEHARVYEK